MQWSSLALGKPPSWSWLIPLPGKYAFTVSLGENLRTMRPALLLSLALRLQSCVRLVAKISSHLSLLMALQKLAGRDFQKNALLHGCSSLQGLDKWLAATGAPPLVSQLYYHNRHTTMWPNSRLVIFFSLLFLDNTRVHAFIIAVKFSGEVSRSLRYCNARPTLDGTGASSWHPIPFQKSV